MKQKRIALGKLGSYVVYKLSLNYTLQKKKPLIYLRAKNDYRATQL